MRVITPGSIPVFLGNASIGTVFSIVRDAAILKLDVFYKEKIVVGFHIIGDEPLYPVIESFAVQETEEAISPQIISFQVSEQEPYYPEYCDIQAVTIQNKEQEDLPKIISFYALEKTPLYPNVDSINVQNTTTEVFPSIITFYAYQE